MKSYQNSSSDTSYASCASYTTYAGNYIVIPNDMSQSITKTTTTATATTPTNTCFQCFQCPQWLCFGFPDCGDCNGCDCGGCDCSGCSI